MWNKTWVEIYAVYHVFGAVKIFSSLSFLIYIVGIKYLFHLAHTVTKDAININKDFCKL